LCAKRLPSGYDATVRRVTYDERQALEDKLLMAQIDKTNLDMARLRQEMWWAPWIALAGILTGVAAMAGIILAVAHVIH